MSEVMTRRQAETIIEQDREQWRRSLAAAHARIEVLEAALDPLITAARRVVKCDYDDFNDALEALDDAFRAAESVSPDRTGERPHE